MERKPMNIRAMWLMALALMGSCLWADGPIFYSGVSEPYSLANLTKLNTKIVKVPDNEADGTCLSWAQYWAPAGTENPASSLIQGRWANPWNTNGVLNDWAIIFKIDRVVTDDLDANGFLNHPQALIEQGIVAPTVTVEFEIIGYIYGNGVVKPSFGQGLIAAFKLISINGRSYWTVPSPMTFNSAEMRLPYNTWIRKSINVPISMVRFPKRAAPGMKPTPIENRLEYMTDAYPMFGFEIDGFRVAWSKARVKAMAPIFLVHGTNATPDTWNEPKLPSGELRVPDITLNNNASFNDYFSDASYNVTDRFPGICFNDITLKSNGSIDDNSGLLAQQVSERLQRVGAKACHLIGHSKGGLDSRAMIIKHYGSPLHENLDQPSHFEVLSLYTLDTPHRGTVLSDVAWNKLNNSNPVADPQWYDLRKVMCWDLPFLHWAGVPDGQTLFGLGAPAGPALEAQTTDSMLRWNEKNVFDFSHKNAQGKAIRFYNTASDADWNKRDGSMDAFELAHMGIPLPGVATSMYRLLYWAREVQTKKSTTTRNGPNGPITFPITILVPVGQEQGQWNDLVVTYSSAVYDGGTLFCPPYLQNFNSINLKNHSSVKNYGMARGIVAQIALDWSVTAP